MEAWEVIEAAHNAYQQRLASVETAGAVVPQEHPDQDKAAASGAAGTSSKVEDCLRHMNNLSAAGQAKKGAKGPDLYIIMNSLSAARTFPFPKTLIWPGTEPVKALSWPGTDCKKP